MLDLFMSKYFTKVHLFSDIKNSVLFSLVKSTLENEFIHVKEFLLPTNAKELLNNCLPSDITRSAP